MGTASPRRARTRRHVAADVRAGRRVVHDAPSGLVHSTVMSSGQSIVGGVVSTTVTLKQQVAVSLALVARGAADLRRAERELSSPRRATQSTSRRRTRPSGRRVIDDAPSGLVHSTVMSSGQSIVGGVVSTTVTSKQQVAVWPSSSVAVQQTSVVPNGNRSPESWCAVDVDALVALRVGRDRERHVRAVRARALGRHVVGAVDRRRRALFARAVADARR